MGDFMSHLLVADLIPIFVIMILGYAAGKQNSFTQDQGAAFNKLVLNYALPAALFISIVKADRAMLVDNAKLTIISVVVITGLFLLSYVTCRLFFKHSKQEGAVCALIAGSPTIGFLGFAVLDPIYGSGTETGLVIAIVAIVVNAITIPIGLYLLNPGSVGGDAGADAGKSSNALVSALKQPVVWTPLLAVALVIIGVKIPVQTVGPTFDLIAKVNSGLAVFAAGLTMSAYKFEFDREIAYNTAFKLILMPGVLLLVGWAFGLESRTLQMLVLSGALPPAFSGIIIASRFKVYTRTGASTLTVSMVGFIIAAPAWVYIAKLVG